MKSNRHGAILDIIEKNDIETQEELISNLNLAGYGVTQATVSRDIRELKLTKIMGENGKYKYVLPAGKEVSGHNAYTNALAASLISVDSAMNIVVVKTYSGMANAVAAGIDSMNFAGVMGCVAGDDTIFVAVRDMEYTAKVATQIRNAAGK